jgi:hypothetical protein
MSSVKDTSKDTSKYITRYCDKYGNTAFGCIIAICKLNENHCIFIEPKSLKEKRSYDSYGNCLKLPDNIAKNCQVGYYTESSHFKIMKEAGFTEYLEKETFDWLNRKTRESQVNVTTWYANGLNLKPGISETQSELY